MDKVYIVTVGSYSDYRIRAVFADEKKAEKYKKMLRDYDAEVDEWALEDDTVFVKQFYMQCAYRVKDCPAKKSMDYKEEFAFAVGTYGIDEEDREEVTRYNKECRSIELTRLLQDKEEPTEERIAELRAKYLKVCQDMAAEIEYKMAQGELPEEKDLEGRE